MTPSFLKSTTAIVLSLSLAAPTATMAQTAAELEAELGVPTANLGEGELNQLRIQYREKKALEESNASSDEEKGLLGQAVDAATDQIEKMTGADEAEATAEAESEAQNDEATAEAAPATEEQPAPEANAEASASTEAETDEPAETAEAEPAQTETDTTAEVTEENASDAARAEEATAEATEPASEDTSAEAQAQAQQDAPETEATETNDELQAQVDDLQQKLDALTNESAEEKAARQAATEAAAAEEQASNMAAASNENTEAAEVVEETVTEDTARASSEEFATDAAAQTGANATAETQSDNDEGLSNLGKVALFGLGALAVGQLLKNGSEVVSNSGDRVVVQQPDGSYKVLKNDDVLMFQPGTDVKTYAFDDGSTRTVATREDGTQIETIRAADGTVLRRTRVLTNGDRVVLFDDTQVAQQVEVNQLPQAEETNRSINFQQAQEDELRAALAANMPQTVDRRFSLSQVRNINAVRNLVPEIDVDNITFETGSSTIRPAEAEELAQLGTLMRQQIEANPGEVFLIEGHTDAVGSASYNLALSDRRAESVALALTEYFDVPPENMVVQGYGEADLKVRTAMAERENRRASVRRITQLLSGS